MAKPIIFLVVIGIVSVAASKNGFEVQYSGPSVFSFPCKENPSYLTLEHEIPDNTNVTANKWKGTFYADLWQSSLRLKIDLCLDAPAEVSVNHRLLHIINLDDTNQNFSLTTLVPLSKATRIEFTIVGLDSNRFPNVKSMSVNGLNLCNNDHIQSNSEVIRNIGQKTLVQEEEMDLRKMCGIRYPVVNTVDSPFIDVWPWHSTIYYKEEIGFKTICGGTLIGKNKVLSVASCLQGMEKSKLMVQVGDSFNATVKEIKIHERFEESNMKDDVMVLILDNPRKTSIKQYPICTYSEWSSVDGDNATVGALDRGAVGGNLREIKVVDSLVCLDNFREVFRDYLSPNNFCAAFKETTSGTPASKVLRGDGFYEKYYDELRKSFSWKIKGIAFRSNVGFSKTDTSGEGDKNVVPHYLLLDIQKYLNWIETLI